MDRIVVGVDGSEGSQRALAWALDDARRRGGVTVEVVHAWEPPVLVGSPVGAVPPVPVDGPYTDVAHQILADAVAAVDSSGLTVEQVVIEGAPGAALCDRSAAAALLVVGSSGHGAVMDALIGSVSQYCAHHAACPLVLIPTQKKAKKKK
jgi:nucleotide-binding universal stress UspA family protein